MNAMSTTPTPFVTSQTLNSDLATSIQFVADALADPFRVAEIADRSDNREPLFGSSMWSPATLSHGWPGTAMFFAELGRRDSSWLLTADRHVRCAVDSLKQHGSSGLFAGPASVLAAVMALEPHYKVLRSRLTEWVAQDQLTRLAEATSRREPGVAWSSYDTMNGLGGTGRLLLAAEQGTATTDPLLHEAVVATINHLCSLAEDICVHDVSVPGWWVPQELQPVEQDRIAYPRGDFNLGLAHGVAGPLAFLSQAFRAGYNSARVSDAIAIMSQWLAQWALSDSFGIYWPCRVSWEDEAARKQGMSLTPPFTRTAWCYGAPGVAAALHQAGTATADDTLLRLADDSNAAIMRRPVPDWRIAGSTICHGLSGVLAAVLSSTTQPAMEVLGPFLRHHASQLAAQLTPSAPFGYVHEMPSSPMGWQHDSAAVLLNGAGLLEGAAGVGCALLLAQDKLAIGSVETLSYDWRSPLMLI